MTCTVALSSPYGILKVIGVPQQSRGQRKDYPIEFLMEKNEM
jgi:hypothetical protein